MHVFADKNSMSGVDLPLKSDSLTSLNSPFTTAVPSKSGAALETAQTKHSHQLKISRNDWLTLCLAPLQCVLATSHSLARIHLAASICVARSIGVVRVCCCKGYEERE